jgi:hypothetical protein
MGREPYVAKFEILPWNFPEGLRKITENLREYDLRAEI